MPVAGQTSKLYLGLQTKSSVADLSQVINDAHDQLFDFIGLPLADQTKKPFQKVEKIGDSREYEHVLAPSASSDLAIAGRRWATSVVGIVSPWVACDVSEQSSHFLNELFQNTDKGAEHRRVFCLEAFTRELSWASHCSMFGVVCPLPLGSHLVSFASALRSYISGQGVNKVWVQVPLCSPQKSASDSWSRWNKLRTISGNSPHLGVALEFTPNFQDEPGVLDRWLSEPIRIVILRTSLFVRNAKGFPVLPMNLRAFLVRLFRHNVHVLFHDDSESNTACAVEKTNNSLKSLGKEEFPELAAETATDSATSEHASGQLLELCKKFVAKIFQLMPKLSQSEMYEEPYWDYLQSPLQPLQDNLEAQTYETFERDPVKYVKYKEAIVAALEDRKSEGKTRHVLMVVGAGRGPLVHVCLEALEQIGIAIEAASVYAVEKNPNAVFSLRDRVMNDPYQLWRNVIVLEGDMRQLQFELEKVDIMVSELLGSFGDNELSPECLYGVQRYLQTDGISIPSRYVSFVEPISTTKLWGDCKALEEGTKAFESTYVACLHSFYRIATEEPKQCFEFVHPNWDITDVNSDKHERFCEVSFTARSDALMHGFAGYFHCNLYKGVEISIVPATSSKDMFSWFPLYIPITEPLLVKKGERICFHLWRRNDPHKVWFEWCLSEPVPVRIHNAGGASSFIGK